MLRKRLIHEAWEVAGGHGRRAAESDYNRTAALAKNRRFHSVQFGETGIHGLPNGSCPETTDAHES